MFYAHTVESMLYVSDILQLLAPYQMTWLCLLQKQPDIRRSQPFVSLQDRWKTIPCHRWRITSLLTCTISTMVCTDPSTACFLITHMSHPLYSWVFFLLRPVVWDWKPRLATLLHCPHQLCPTEMPYSPKNVVTILMRAALDDLLSKAAHWLA